MSFIDKKCNDDVLTILTIDIHLPHIIYKYCAANFYWKLCWQFDYDGDYFTFWKSSDAYM